LTQIENENNAIKLYNCKQCTAQSVYKEQSNENTTENDDIVLLSDILIVNVSYAPDGCPTKRALLQMIATGFCVTSYILQRM
jgi:hypothetical protein